MEPDGILVKFFSYVLDKGYQINDLEYTINEVDIDRKIDPPVIKQVSKTCGWVLFKATDLDTSYDSYSDFSI